MTDKQLIKDFIVAIANDDYIGADKVFPKVVSSAVKTVINNRKPDVIKTLSAEAEAIASKSVKEKNDDKGK